MSEEESGIVLKIQDKTIPTHKQILIENSTYFANLFKSCTPLLKIYSHIIRVVWLNQHKK